MTVIPLTFKPGIQRDGTRLDSDGSCVDGQWVRWQKGRPRKMKGYNLLQQDLKGPIYSTYAYSKNNITYLMSGSGSFLESVQINTSSPAAGAISDRTPAADFVADDNNLWSVVTMYNGAGTNQVVIAHAAPNLSDITNSTTGYIFYGDDTAVTPLVTLATAPQVSGGIALLHPYLFAYGDDGLIQWCEPGNPTNWSTGGAGDARIASEKIIKGVPVRGGTSSPAGLFWSLSSLFKVTFTGGAAIFRSDFIGDVTLLSQNAVIEYQGGYFFPSTDNFHVYNGTLQELPNDFSKSYFFEGLNKLYRQKVWGIANYNNNELTWFYPRGTATECTHYVTCNIKEGTWYDGEIGRSAGFFNRIFGYPLMIDTETTPDGLSYKLWLHEVGLDRVEGSSFTAIRSYFETPVLPNFIENVQTNTDGAYTEIHRMEPDFAQVGEMSMVVTGEDTAQGSESLETTHSFTPTEKYITMVQQRRLMRLRFESNVAGGNYWMGKPLVDLRPGDKSLPHAGS